MTHLELALLFAPQDMMLLFAIGFLLFGPQKLPEIGEALGKTMRAFREGSSKMMDELSRETRGAQDDHQVQRGNYPQAMPMPAQAHVAELADGHPSEAPVALVAGTETPAEISVEAAHEHPEPALEVVHGEVLREAPAAEVAPEIHHPVAVTKLDTVPEVALNDAHGHV